MSDRCQVPWTASIAAWKADRAVNVLYHSTVFPWQWALVRCPAPTRQHPDGMGGARSSWVGLGSARAAWTWSAPSQKNPVSLLPGNPASLLQAHKLSAEKKNHSLSFSVHSRKHIGESIQGNQGSVIRQAGWCVSGQPVRRTPVANHPETQYEAHVAHCPGCPFLALLQAIRFHFVLLSQQQRPSNHPNAAGTRSSPARGRGDGGTQAGFLAPTCEGHRVLGPSLPVGLGSKVWAWACTVAARVRQVLQGWHSQPARRPRLVPGLNYSANLRKRTHELWPPKPKELDSATSTST